MSEFTTSQLLVNVFYYDYVISEAIDVYISGKQPILATTYLQVATILSKELRSSHIKLDDQLYMKEAFLKLLQMLRFYKTKFSVDKSGCNLSIITKGFGTIRSIIQENPSIEKDSRFLTFEMIAVAIYQQLSKDGRKNDLENCEDANFIGNLAQTEGVQRALTELIESFSVEAAMKLLEPIHFEHPVMEKFIDFVKSGIDNSCQY